MGNKKNEVKNLNVDAIIQKWREQASNREELLAEFPNHRIVIDLDNLDRCPIRPDGTVDEVYLRTAVKLGVFNNSLGDLLADVALSPLKAGLPEGEKVELTTTDEGKTYKLRLWDRAKAAVDKLKEWLACVPAMHGRWLTPEGWEVYQEKAVKERPTGRTRCAGCDIQ